MRLGVRLRPLGDPGELLADARAIEASGADALWADARDGDPYVLLAALAAVTWRVRLVASGMPAATGRTTCERLARGRLAVAEELAAEERWVHAPFPESRAAWRQQRAEAEVSGVAGITLPSDPRLIDLLRNPDREDDRSDLNIAVG